MISSPEKMEIQNTDFDAVALWKLLTVCVIKKYFRNFAREMTYSMCESIKQEE